MTYMEGCTFCDIYKRPGRTEIIVRKSDHYVIFDKYPASKGHLLIISNKHYENMLETPNKTIISMMITSKMFGKLFMDRLDADGVKITTNIGAAANQVIMHTHIHVIPRYLPHKHKDFRPHEEILHNERAELRVRILRALKK